jgi:hypothetical protein
MFSWIITNNVATTGTTKGKGKGKPKRLYGRYLELILAITLILRDMFNTRGIRMG